VHPWVDVFLICRMYVQEAASLCISHCIVIDRTDMLFGSIYRRLSESALKKAAFIECLEPYILSGELTRVAANVMNDFVAHYEKKDALGVVEACIINVDIASIDVQQVHMSREYSVCRSLTWKVGKSGN